MPPADAHGPLLDVAAARRAQLQLREGIETHIATEETLERAGERQQAGAFERRIVEPFLEESSEVAINSGVKPGEQVVVRGGILLND